MIVLAQRAGDRVCPRRCDDRPKAHIEWTRELSTERQCQVGWIGCHRYEARVSDQQSRT